MSSVSSSCWDRSPPTGRIERLPGLERLRCPLRATRPSAALGRSRCCPNRRSCRRSSGRRCDRAPPRPPCSGLRGCRAGLPGCRPSSGWRRRLGECIGVRRRRRGRGSDWLRWGWRLGLGSGRRVGGRRSLGRSGAVYVPPPPPESGKRRRGAAGALGGGQEVGGVVHGCHSTPVWRFRDSGAWCSARRDTRGKRGYDGSLSRGCGGGGSAGVAEFGGRGCGGIWRAWV